MQGRWEPWRWRAEWPAIGSWQWPSESHHESLSSYNYMRSCQELNVSHPTVICHLKQIGKVIKLDKWVCHALTENFKKSSFCSVIFTYSTQQWTISWSDCDVWQKVNFIWQPVMTSSVVGQEAPNHFSKPNLHQKSHGQCLMICHPSDSLQLSESCWNYYIWELCSANQWDALKTAMPTAGTGQQNGPNSFPRQHLTVGHTTIASKIERIGLQSFGSSAIIHLTSHQPTTTSSSISTIFLQGKHFQQVAGNAFQEFVESWSMDFYATEINLFLVGKNVLIIMV